MNDEDYKSVVDLIIENARTGNIGDGKIFITDIVETIRVRDGAKGTESKEII